jgi:hypothetical protein
MPTKNGSVTTAETSGTQASLTVSHTVSAGSNRCLVIGIAGVPAGSPTTNSRTVTWNSQSLTRVGIQAYATNEDFVELWYLLEASLSTTTANVVVTAVTANQYLSIGVQTWDGVNQAAPFGTWVGSGTTQNGTTASVTCTTVAGDEVIDILGCWGSGAHTITPTYTALWERENAGAQDDSGQSSRTASGVSTDIGWSMSENVTLWYGAAPLSAASAAQSQAPRSMLLGVG